MGPFGFSMTAVHRHNCLARAINTVSLEKEEEKKKKKEREESVAAPKGESSKNTNEFSKFIPRIPVRSSILKEIS